MVLGVFQDGLRRVSRHQNAATGDDGRWVERRDDARCTMHTAGGRAGTDSIDCERVLRKQASNAVAVAFVVALGSTARSALLKLRD